jgi:hypothetical protein
MSSVGLVTFAFGLRDTCSDLSSKILSFLESIFLHPFAPQALPRFQAPMDALTSVAATPHAPF